MNIISEVWFGPSSAAPQFERSSRSDCSDFLLVFPSKHQYLLSPPILPHLVPLPSFSPGSLSLSQFRAGKNALISFKDAFPSFCMESNCKVLKSIQGLSKKFQHNQVPLLLSVSTPFASFIVSPLDNVYLCLFHQTEYPMRTNNDFTHLPSPCHSVGNNIYLLNS